MKIENIPIKSQKLLKELFNNLSETTVKFAKLHKSSESTKPDEMGTTDIILNCAIIYSVHIIGSFLRDVIRDDKLEETLDNFVTTFKENIYSIVHQKKK